MSDKPAPKRSNKDDELSEPDSKKPKLPATQENLDGRVDISEIVAKVKKPNSEPYDWNRVVYMENGDIILLDENSNVPPLTAILFPENGRVLGGGSNEQNNGEQAPPENPFNLHVGNSAADCDGPVDEASRQLMLDRFDRMSLSQRLEASWNGVFPMTWAESSFGSDLVEHGIANRSTKCYLISAIQLLSHAPPFAIIMGIHDSVNGCNIEDCLACEWKNLQFSKTTEVGNLDRFIEILKVTWPVVGTETCEDVEECVYKIFQHFRAPKYDSLGLRSIIDIFKLVIGVEDICVRCKMWVERDQEYDIILKLMSSNRFDHVQMAIDDLFQPEPMPGRKCGVCEVGDVVRSRFLKKTPNVLLVSDSKRAVDGYGDFIHICKNVNLGKHGTVPDSKFGMYELCGIVNHVWIVPGVGHYFALTKKYGKNSEWVEMNDSQVTPGMPDPFGTPYMLMYRRVIHSEKDQTNETAQTH